jgi:hypothetical protein
MNQDVATWNDRAHLHVPLSDADLVSRSFGLAIRRMIARPFAPF